MARVVIVEESFDTAPLINALTCSAAGFVLMISGVLHWGRQSHNIRVSHVCMG